MANKPTYGNLNASHDHVAAAQRRVMSESSRAEIEAAQRDWMSTRGPDADKAAPQQSAQTQADSTSNAPAQRTGGPAIIVRDAAPSTGVNPATQQSPAAVKPQSPKAPTV